MIHELLGILRHRTVKGSRTAAAMAAPSKQVFTEKSFVNSNGTGWPRPFSRTARIRSPYPSTWKIPPCPTTTSSPESFGSPNAAAMPLMAWAVTRAELS